MSLRITDQRKTEINAPQDTDTVVSDNPNSNYYCQSCSIDTPCTITALIYRKLQYRQDPARTLIGLKPMFYKSRKREKSVFYCFARKSRCLSRLRTLEKCRNTLLRLVFSTFLSCFQMPVVFYHSVIRGLAFFIC